MANEEHFQIANQGAEAIGAWRKQNPDVRMDLSRANFNRADLSEANLSEANLQRGEPLSWRTL